MPHDIDKSVSLLFLGTQDDRSYLPKIKPLIKGAKCFVDLKTANTFAEIESYCKHPTRNITGVLCTQESLLRRFTGKDNSSISNYAGSYFKRNGIEYVFLDPLEQLVTVPYGSFLAERFISKLVSPETWLPTTEFKWCVLRPDRYQEAFRFLSSCSLIASDIETFSNPLSIRCIGYTGLKDTGKGYESFSYVLPIDTQEALAAMRTINALPIPKIFQNGKYDIAYLSRYNAVPSHYYWDTAALFHCLYSELPKDLAFLQSFYVREAAYWKDLADTNDLEQYYLYNAKDTWATAHVFLGWIREAPDWAMKNYTLEFPVQFPCHMCEMIGVQRDMERMSESRSGIDSMIESRSASLDKILGVTGFNVNSPPQMKALLALLGCDDLSSADAKNLAKAAYRHPVNSRILDLITGVPKTDDLQLMGIRSLRKAKSTYLRTDDDITKTSKGGRKELSGTDRILYALNPHQTDTGRLASKEHHFWCGFNIQNIPVGDTVKRTIVADPGFLFGESDLEQAEARDVAHISGDTALIAAVSGDKDFHSTNASAFFGVPYESIYSDELRKAINKALRNLAKRVNHGANYNMGAFMLVDTMGEKAIYEAARILALPKGWTSQDIAQFLLDRFDKTYPIIRGAYQRHLVEQIVTTKMLVGATGWTRYCFSDPRKSKPALNSYVAHPSQSLNAMVLNQAFMKVFYDIAIHQEHARNFKLCAQIHDSIFFQYREGHDYLCEMVRERMEIPVTVTDIFGKTRTFTVPAALKIGTKDAPAKYWNETE